MEELEKSTSLNEGGLLGLPETDTELNVSRVKSTLQLYGFTFVDFPSRIIPFFIAEFDWV